MKRLLSILLLAATAGCGADGAPGASVSGAAAPLVSDDFNGTLAPEWTWVDPVGDSSYALTGAGTPDAHLEISVPAGTEHDAWRLNEAARMVQATGDVDFELEAKFDSVPSERYQLQGIVAELDDDDFVRFDFYSDGKQVRFFSASFSGGSPSIRANDVVSLTAGHRLRVKRAGDTWTAMSSADGSGWTQLVSFTHAMTVANVGVMAGNDNGGPAYTASIDYFINSASPLPDEDVTSCEGPLVLATTVVGAGGVSLSPDQPEYACGDVVTLTATPDAGHQFVGFSGDVVDTSSQTQVTLTADIAVTATFEPIPPPPPSAVSSDDFSGALDPAWIFVDPMGDSSHALVGAGTADAQLALSVPQGSEHDPWKQNMAARMVQPVVDGDFEVEAKFDSVPSERFQLHGIVVEDDQDDFLRFDFYSDGNQVRFFAASTVAGKSSVRSKTVVSLSAGHRLRVGRTGDTWTASWSADGSSWTEVSSFNHAIAVEQVGVMGGNANGGPAYTALVDYFFDTGSPIDPEDPVAPCTGPFALDLAVVGSGSVDVSPAKPEYACGETVTLTATPDAGNAFVGFSGDVVDTSASLELTMDSDVAITALFEALPPACTGPFVLDVTAVGGGTVAVSPDKAEYDCDEVVTLTATADAGFEFVGFSGDVLDASPTVDITMTADVAVTATFQALPPACMGPFALDVTVVGGGTVAASPDKAGYDCDEVVTLTATADAGFEFVGFSGDVVDSSPTIDVTMTAAVAITALFEALPPPPAAVLNSDDFSGALDPAWVFVDPMGDSSHALVGAGTQDAQLALSVPQGTEHDPWQQNMTARLVQAITDVDFEVEAKFDSVPSLKYQLHGISVEDDQDDFIRFDFYADGNQVYFFAASFVGGVPTARVNSPVSIAPGHRLRITRSGNTFTAARSADGISWSTLVSFNHAIAVKQVGVMAGNDDGGPAYTALVDYVFDTASPVIPEDPTTPCVGPLAVDVAVLGSGSVDVSPAKESYDCGDVVTLTATPDPDNAFVGYTGDVVDTGSQVVVQLTADLAVTAEFEAVETCVGGPYTVDVAVVGAGTVTRSPDKAQYGCGEQVTVSATAAAGYAFGGFSGDVTSSQSSIVLDALSNISLTATFTELPPAAIVSDDFSGLLESAWYFVDPLDDASFTQVGAGTADPKIAISVPAGAEHDAWQVNQAPRLMQQVPDADFEVEAKFDSLPSQQYQLHGIVVEQDEDDFIRFDFFSDGADLRFFAAGFVNTVHTIYYNEVVAVGVGHRLRVTRSGDTWTAAWSADGNSWSTLATFDHAIDVAAVGVMGGNAGVSPSYTALVDYFFDTSAPIDPEDGPPCAPEDTFSVTVQQTTGGTVTVAPQQGQYTCGDVIQVEALADEGYTFIGWTQGPYGKETTSELGVYSDIVLEGEFVQAVINFDLWYGDTLEFGYVGNAQDYVNVLGHVEATAGVASAGFRVNGGSLQPLSLDRETYRLIAEGDFNVDIPLSWLQPGDNIVELSVEDSLGLTAQQIVHIDWVPDNVWPTDYSVDWSQAAEIQDVAQIVDGKWVLEGDGVRIIEPGYDRLLAFGDDSWTDLEMHTTFVVNSLKDPEFWPPVLGVVSRWSGHYNWDGGVRPYRGWYPMGGIVTYSWPVGGTFEGVKLWLPDGSTRTHTDVPPMEVGVEYHMRFRLTSLSGGYVQYEFKYWPVGETEPAQWAVVTDSEMAAPSSGSLMLVAHNVDVTFGDVQITGLP